MLEETEETIPVTNPQSKPPHLTAAPSDMVSLSDLEELGDTITPEAARLIEKEEDLPKIRLHRDDHFTAITLVISRRLKALEDRMTRLEYRKLRKKGARR